MNQEVGEWWQLFVTQTKNDFCGLLKWIIVGSNRKLMWQISLPALFTVSFSYICLSLSHPHLWSLLKSVQALHRSELKCFEEECVRDPTGNLQNQLFYSTLWGELLCNSISTVEKSILAVTCHGQVDKIDSEWITHYTWFKVWPEISTSF